MKKILLGIAILLLITSSSCSQESKQPLQFTIKSDKKVYGVGEQIKVNLEFKNKSDDIASIRLDKQDRFAFFEFIISKDANEPRICSIGIGKNIYDKKIAPGDYYSTDIVISELDRIPQKPIFYEPGRDNTGRYEITITYRGDMTITSNTITIEVKGKKIDLPPNLSFLSDVPEFQGFRFQMSEQEIREIAQRGSLILEGNSQDGFIITNINGETLTLSMSGGRCCGIQRLRKQQPPLQLIIKSDKQVYGLGEEIKLVVTLKNNSNKEMIVYWPKGGPTIVTDETNVFTVVVDASRATELIYIKPRETFEKYISINLKINLIPGPCSVTMEYMPPTMFDHIINIEKQEIWSVPLISNTITIEVRKKDNSPGQTYFMELKFNYDGKKHWWTFKLDNNEFSTLREMKKFIKNLPAGSKIEWAPTCIRMGDEPLLNSESEMKAFEKFCDDNGITLVIIPSG